MRGAVGEGRADGEPRALGARGESVARFMVPRALGVQPYGVRSVRIEDIATIEGACVYAHEHSVEIPRELFRHVWEVRAGLKGDRLRELACTYSIIRQ